jgi:hypothetical protein
MIAAANLIIFPLPPTLAVPRDNAGGVCSGPSLTKPGALRQRLDALDKPALDAKPPE